MDQTMLETGVPHSEEAAQSEHEQRARNLRGWVEGKILTQHTGEERVDIGSELSTLPLHERAGVLYGKLMAYSTAQRMIQEEKRQTPYQEPEPVDPYLIAEIKSLWEDKPTQDLFVGRFADARIDAKLQRHSNVGKKWEQVNEDIGTTREAFEEETRRLFLQQITRPDQVSAAQGRTQRFASELIRLEKERDGVINLRDLPSTPENTDVSAMIMAEQIARYHEEANSGFVWLPSRTEIHNQTIAALQNGRWPVLRGEAGSGKSEQADAAAVALTGEQPTHIACGPNTSSRELIADPDFDPEKGRFEKYGAVMQAASGFENSLQTEPVVRSGRIVRLDESGRLGSKGYSDIKEVRQKRTATPDEVRRFQSGEQIPASKLLHGKPVLPGFSSIWATNPEGPRYPDRHEPDPAMRRELSYITVDYPPMTADSPELFEFMLATLMDDNKHIPVAKGELSPKYVIDNERVGQILGDGSKITKAEKIADDPTDKEHGTLYRFAFAVRAIQDAFNAGNMISVPEGALRYDPEIGVVTEGGDPLTLSSSTITLGEVASWMKGFRERRLKDEESYHVDSMSSWLKRKVEGYIAQADEEDRGKIRAVFDHFNLLEERKIAPNEQPITPKEIGYLSPRVKRPIEVQQTTKEPGDPPVKPDTGLHTNRQVLLEDGSPILAHLEPYTLFTNQGKKIHLKDGRTFTMNGEKLRFVGSNPEGSRAVVEIVATDGLHRLIELDQLRSEGEFDNTLETARELFGEDFLGPEAVEKTFGIEIPEDKIPEISNYFTQEDLERAKELGQRLVLRIPLTMKKMQEMLQAQFEKDGKGKVLWDTGWYQNERFFTTERPRPKWALVSNDVIPGSTGKHYLDQTIALADYLQDVVFKGQAMPDEYKVALTEYKAKRGKLEDAMIDVQSGSGDWKKLAQNLSELKLNQLFRHTPAEVLYDMLMVYENLTKRDNDGTVIGDEARFLPDMYTWTNVRSQDGYLVYVGYSGAVGASVGTWYPGSTDGGLGVAFSR